MMDRTIDITLPDDVLYIIETLEACGFEAYAVGGCIRDTLMSQTPKDWDVCTSALPEQTLECFEGYNVIKTGLKHGTVTLMLGNKPYEITTYRCDSKYTDHRHPDRIKFVDVLKRDLARRDFTINAMAYSPKRGLKDYYGSREDLENKVIKCVGNPHKRFNEDALRILRAMRFASVYSFTIEEKTAQAMRDNKDLLREISSERISAELAGILTGDGVFDVLTEFADVLAAVIPELLPLKGFVQYNPHHCYDVYTHMLHSIVNSPKDPLIRLTMLLHDVGKPSCFSRSDDGIGHFYNHAAAGAEIARKILNSLRFDNNTISTVSQLIYYHDYALDNPKQIKKLLGITGIEGFSRLLIVKKADIMAQAEPVRAKKLRVLDDAAAILEKILAEKQCFSLSDLAINGKDLLEAGVTDGKQIGALLRELLDMVIEDIVVNDKEKLMEIVKTRISMV